MCARQKKWGEATGDMKFLIFTTIKKLYYLSDEGYKELQKTVEIYKADLEVDEE